MFSKENMLRNLIILIVGMILGAVVISLAIDSKGLFLKKDKNNTNIMYANEVE